MARKTKPTTTYTPIAPGRVDEVFEKLSTLTDRVVRNDWNDRVVGRFSTMSRVDEDYEPVAEDDK